MEQIQDTLFPNYRNVERASELIGFKIPIDGFMTAVLGYKHIDIIKLDEQLKRKHPNYDDDMSMTDFITTEYGTELNQIIESLI